MNRLQESCRRCEAEISKLSGSLQMCRKKNLELKGVNEKQRSEILSLRDLVRTMQKSLDVYARWGANEMYSSDEEEDEEEEEEEEETEEKEAEEEEEEEAEEEAMEDDEEEDEEELSLIHI